LDIELWLASLKLSWGWLVEKSYFNENSVVQLEPGLKMEALKERKIIIQAMQFKDTE